MLHNRKPEIIAYAHPNASNHAEHGIPENKLFLFLFVDEWIKLIWPLLFCQKLVYLRLLSLIQCVVVFECNHDFVFLNLIWYKSWFILTCKLLHNLRQLDSYDAFIEWEVRTRQSKSGAISTDGSSSQLRLRVHRLVLWSRCDWACGAHEPVATHLRMVCESACWNVAIGIIKTKNLIYTCSINSSTWCECERTSAFAHIHHGHLWRQTTITHSHTQTHIARVDGQKKNRHYLIRLDAACVALCLWFYLAFQIWQLFVFFFWFAIFVVLHHKKAACAAKTDKKSIGTQSDLNLIYSSFNAYVTSLSFCWLLLRLRVGCAMKLIICGS